MNKKTILLTGPTGNMGLEGLRHLYKARDEYNIVLFVRQNSNDEKILGPYKNKKGISIVWGDLTKYEDVKKAVKNVDIVLHVGALVSPLADHHPRLAWETNFGGTKNIVDAILARTDSETVKLVYIGTVAQIGNRVPPYHWGRIGDPLTPSVFDYYALSKIAAERYVIESGLKNWVSLRQTGILHRRLLSMNDGIAYHQPLNNHLEWVTVGDSGRLLRNICAINLPQSFWNNTYNIGGGDGCRFTSYQFYQKIYHMMGVNIQDLEQPNHFALRNFHGHYFYDSDKLNNYLDFRTESVDDVLAQLKKKLPFALRILKYLPKKVVRKIMTRKAVKGDTPLNWIASKNNSKIKAFFGSKELWEKIPDWHSFKVVANPPHKKLNHGYDESIPDKDIVLEDLKSAAKFRGGVCLASSMIKGDLKTKLRWRCAENHEFIASPYLILKTGHWCSHCLKTPWNFDKLAKTNPFIAQVWHSDHDMKEDNIYQ